MRAEASVLLVTMLWACQGPGAGQPPPAGTGEDMQGPGRPPGSTRTQGTRIQGTRIQGTRIQGIRLQGIKVQGAGVDNLRIEGTRLTGTRMGQQLSGTDFVGATVTGVDAGGTGVDLTISAVEHDPQDSSGEIFLYTLLHFNAATSAMENACETDPDGVAKAIPVAGIWDDTGAHLSSSSYFTFGCTIGVVAKCVRWGYWPFGSAAGKPLADYHQACTRLARADYCGDGVSHTVDGTLVDVYDDLGVLRRTPGSGLLFDSAWTPDGAYCVSKERWLDALDIPPAGCRTRFVNLDDLKLAESSRVDPTDVCLLKRMGVDRGAVLLDNRSALNVK